MLELPFRSKIPITGYGVVLAQAGTTAVLSSKSSHQLLIASIPQTPFSNTDRGY